MVSALQNGYRGSCCHYVSSKKRRPRSDKGLTRMSKYKQRSDAGQSRTYTVNPDIQRQQRSDAGQSHTYTVNPDIQRQQRSDAGQSRAYTVNPDIQRQQRSDAGQSHTYTVNPDIQRRQRLNVENVNFDAKTYSDKFDAYTKFEICGICAVEESDMDYIDLENNSVVQSLTKLMNVYTERVKDFQSDRISVQEKSFLEDLQLHIPNGILQHAKFVCKTCSKYITHNTAIPPKALINGLYVGSVPDELRDLNFVESSMICINSCVSKLKILRPGEHYRTKPGPTYTFINDLVKTTSQLPRMLDKDDIALIRHKNDNKQVDYQYRPYRVWSALRWLKDNNHLYKDIELVWPTNIAWQSSTDQYMDIPFIDMSEEDVAELHNELNANIATTLTGFTGNIELQQETDVLLFATSDINTHEEDIRQILDPTSLVRHSSSGIRQFTSPYQDPDFFWAKCFPCLYPYGFGCPSDPYSKLKQLKPYVQHILQRGGGPQGRRFQSTPHFYFAVYHYESRRNIGSIAYQAQNEELDTAGPQLTALRLRQLISRIDSTNVNSTSTITETRIDLTNETNVNSTSTTTETRIDSTNETNANSTSTTTEIQFADSVSD